MSRKRDGLFDGTYIVLVRSLYQTLLPSSIMGLAFLGVGSLVALESADQIMLWLTILGTAAALTRFVIVLQYRPAAMRDDLTAKKARILERRFAVPYLTFAVLFGAFNMRAFQVAPSESHMLVVALLVGYAAGVASGVFLRPWIALVSVLLAVLPTIVVTLTTPDLTYVAVGLLLATLLAGGIERMMWNYRATSAEITMRRDYASLARTDALTGLSNRLSLREKFDACLEHAEAEVVFAVHCLDLDHFKTVNDLYGHPIGDALLKAVSARLEGLLRRGDIAARTGGDEFVIIQTTMKHAGEADLLAHRIVRAISEPFSLGGRQLTIGTSVGYSVVTEGSESLDVLIANADNALIDVKRVGGGVRRYSEVLSLLQRKACA